MNKRGLYFTIDAVLAVTILVLGVGSVILAYVGQTEETSQYALAYSLVNTISSRTIKDIGTQDVYDIVGDEKGMDYSDSIARSLGYLYDKYKNANEDDKEGIKNNIKTIVNQMVNQGYLISEPLVFALYIEEEQFYPSSDRKAPDDVTRIAASTIAIGLNENNVKWGPYTIEVRIW